MAKLSEKEAFDFMKAWAEEFGTDAQKGYFENEEYALKALALCMGVGGKKRRKDFVCAKQATEMISYFFDNTFAPDYAYRFENAAVKKVLEGFKSIYDQTDDNSVWFEKVKTVAGENGFATDMKAYKANPEAYPGNVSDVAEMLRIATTGLANTPDLWTIMQILGKERTLARLEKAISSL
jgi:glutamyl-tRNA synthetase